MASSSSPRSTVTADDGALRRTTGVAAFPGPLSLAGGGILTGFEIAYETYGTLSPARDNGILVCHGLTSSQNATGRDPTSTRPGWWEIAIGPGRMLDTDRWFVVCSNVLGGSAGSTAPRSIDPATGRRWGLRFPIVTIADMVDAQAALSDQFGIDCWHAVIGGCMGGFQVYEWARRHPRRLRQGIAISATPATSAYTIALWEVMRQAIYADPAFAGGDYTDDRPPLAGLGLSGMIGAVLWLDRDTLATKYGRKPAMPDAPLGRTLAPEFAVERFLADIRGNAHARFDPNSLIYLTKAVDLFDLGHGHAGLGDAIATIAARMLLVSYASDWRYPAAEIEDLAAVMRARGIDARYAALDSHIGHGAFQFDVSALSPVVADFLGR